MVTERQKSHAKVVFRRAGGILRTRDALEAGIHPRTLYGMRDAGDLEALSRGVYRLTEMPLPEDFDLVTVASRVPAGVICLISALSFHDLTTQVPHEIYLALPRGARRPKLDFPPLRIFWFNQVVFSQGIEVHDRDGVQVRVYSPEKTIADCFKYRRKIGFDVAVEALRLLRERGPLRVQELVRFAETDQVEHVMRPYLEALV